MANIQSKSMFGAQPSSGRHSAPAYGFGSGTRNHVSKLFAGSEMAKTSSISITPGPCYETIDAVGAQADSGKNSYPQWQFGTAERFGAGPRGRSPGPGAYENAGSFGKQELSHRHSFALYGFGTSNRHNVAKVFISTNHEKSKHGEASPGPAALYQRGSALEGPEYGFGTDERYMRRDRHLNDAGELPALSHFLALARRLASSSSAYGSRSRSHLAWAALVGVGHDRRPSRQG